MNEVVNTVDNQRKIQVNKLNRTLNNIKTLLKKFVVADEEVLTVLATWIAHTYIWQELQFTPYLNIWSAERESGKSTVFSWLRIFCKNSFVTSGATTSAIQRTVDSKKPTLLFDEVDAVFTGNNLTPDQKDMIAFFNSGFERGGMVIKTRMTDLKVQEFTSFCPKAFASIGADVLPDTTRSRSIHLPMKRKTSAEVVERNRQRNRDKYKENISQIIENLSAWADETTCYDNVVELPEQLSDRNMDIYEPLFQIVNEAGEEWLTSFTQSAIHLSGKKDTAIETGTQLLIDTQSIITEKEFDDQHLMFTTDYINDLCEYEESPWALYRRSSPINPKSLAGLLRKYNIRSQKLREGRGYLVGDFKDAIERFAKEHLNTEQSATSVTQNSYDVAHVAHVADSGSKGFNGQSSLVDIAKQLGATITDVDEAPKENELLEEKDYDEFNPT